MAAPTLEFGSGTISIATTASPTVQYECQVTGFTVAGASNIGQVAGTYCQGPSSYASGSSFSVDLTYLTDWSLGAAASLSQLLWDNDGDILFFEFEPDGTGMPTCAGSFYAVAGNFGGEGDGLWTTTSNMPCTEKPVLTPPV